MSAGLGSFSSSIGAKRFRFYLLRPPFLVEIGIRAGFRFKARHGRRVSLGFLFSCRGISLRIEAMLNPAMKLPEFFRGLLFCATHHRLERDSPSPLPADTRGDVVRDEFGGVGAGRRELPGQRREGDG